MTRRVYPNNWVGRWIEDAFAAPLRPKPEYVDPLVEEVASQFKEAWDVYDATLLMTDGDKQLADRAFYESRKAYHERQRKPKGNKHGDSTRVGDEDTSGQTGHGQGRLTGVHEESSSESAARDDDDVVR